MQRELPGTTADIRTDDQDARNAAHTARCEPGAQRWAEQWERAVRENVRRERARSVALTVAQLPDGTQVQQPVVWSTCTVRVPRPIDTEGERIERTEDVQS